jgi:hypothetical protein
LIAKIQSCREAPMAGGTWGGDRRVLFRGVASVVFDVVAVRSRCLLTKTGSGRGIHAGSSWIDFSQGPRVDINAEKNGFCDGVLHIWSRLA